MQILPPSRRWPACKESSVRSQFSVFLFKCCVCVRTRLCSFGCTNCNVLQWVMCLRFVSSRGKVLAFFEKSIHLPMCNYWLVFNQFILADVLWFRCTRSCSLRTSFKKNLGPRLKGSCLEESNLRWCFCIRGHCTQLNYRTQSLELLIISPCGNDSFWKGHIVRSGCVHLNVPTSATCVIVLVNWWREQLSYSITERVTIVIVFCF